MEKFCQMVRFLFRKNSSLRLKKVSSESGKIISLAAHANEDVLAFSFGPCQYGIVHPDRNQHQPIQVYLPMLLSRFYLNQLNVFSILYS